MIPSRRKKSLHRFFYKNSFYKNHQAQNCQKIKNILRFMARLKYIIKNLECPILILHQELALFTMACLLFTIEGLQFRKTCVRNQHTSQSISITFLLCYVYFIIEIFLCFSLFSFFASCFALRQNAFTIPCDFLFYILCNLGQFKRNYEYNLSLIYKVPI